jgi:hypothetical protein
VIDSFSLRGIEEIMRAIALNNADDNSFRIVLSHLSTSRWPKVFPASVKRYWTSGGLFDELDDKNTI